jgi:CAAX protease family protein
MLALYLILKVRYRRPVVRALGWLWPTTTCAIISTFLGVVLAAGVQISQNGRIQNAHTTPWIAMVTLGVVFAPILEESFFRGCLLPLLASSLGRSLAVVLTALLFAIFHGPANLAHWVSFTGTGLTYGWIRVTFRSTTGAALAHAAYNLALYVFARF